MPVQSKSVRDRELYCPTVYEKFGCHPDIPIYRCCTDLRGWFHGPVKTKEFRVCPAEFGYKYRPGEEEDSAEDDDGDDEIERRELPFIETVNLYILTGEVFHTHIHNAKKYDVVACKLCEEFVGIVTDKENISLRVCQKYTPAVDDLTHNFPTEARIPENHIDRLKVERERFANIPFAVAGYKKRHHMPKERGDCLLGYFHPAHLNE